MSRAGSETLNGQIMLTDVEEQNGQTQRIHLYAGLRFSALHLPLMHWTQTPSTQLTWYPTMKRSTTENIRFALL